MLRNKYLIILAVVLVMTVGWMSGCGETAPAVTQTALTLTTTSLPNAVIGIAYSQTMQAYGGSSPYNWSIIEGSLPGGFSLSPKTGGISGMPMNAGTHNFTIQLKDSSGTVVTRPLFIAINAATVPLTSGTSYAAIGEEGVPYVQPLKAYGGSGTYTWEIAGGTLPEGVSLNGTTLSGIPKTAGKYIFSTKVTDNQGAFATQSLTITVNKRVNISTEKLEFGEIDTIYSRRVEALNGIGDFTFYISDGKLPDGLAINAGTGEITGTAKTSGTFIFTAKVTDSIGGTSTRSLSIEIKPAVSLHTTTLPSGQVGKAYSATLEYSGGNGEYVWTMETGSLPDGVTMDGNTGAISGTPKIAGDYTFSIELIDSWGSSDKKELSIKIEP